MNTTLQSEASRLRAQITKSLEVAKQQFNEYNKKAEELSNELQTNRDLATDRSENNSFQVTKESRDIAVMMAMKESNRIEALQTGLADYTPTGIITLGTTVELRILVTSNTITGLNFDRTVFMLVPHEIEDSINGLVSFDSPVGIAILGKCVNDVIDVNTVSCKITYKIERIY